MTKEEFIDFKRFKRENHLNLKSALKQKSITYHNYYKSQRLFSEEKSQLSPSISDRQGRFIPLILESDLSKKEISKSKSKIRRERELANGNVLTIEMRTPTGTELRIVGQMNVSMLREILNSSTGGIKDV